MVDDAAPDPADPADPTQPAPVAAASPMVARPNEDPPRGGLGGRLAGLSPSGRARVPAAWATYDFANTIFSYAIVSTAIGLWLTEDDNFGQDIGQLV
nr:hypothetical protein [Chloroflexota bacterium]